VVQRKNNVRAWKTGGKDVSSSRRGGRAPLAEISSEKKKKRGEEKREKRKVGPHGLFKIQAKLNGWETTDHSQQALFPK